MLQHNAQPFITPAVIVLALMMSHLWSEIDASPVINRTPRVELDQKWKNFKVTYKKDYGGTATESLR